MNKLPEFTYAKRNGSYWEYSKEILKNPNLYFADQNIEDYYKTKYIIDNADPETGDQTVAPRYNMCFSDTEVDISNYSESFPDPSIAPCAINLITNIYSETKECITYVLYDERIAKDQQWVVEHKDEFIKQYLDPIIVEEGLKFDIKVYAKEDDLIKVIGKDDKGKKISETVKFNTDAVLGENESFEFDLTNTTGQSHERDTAY